MVANIWSQQSVTANNSPAFFLFMHLVLLKTHKKLNSTNTQTLDSSFKNYM